MINTYEGKYIVSTQDGQYESEDLLNFNKLERNNDVMYGNLCQTCINNYSCTTLLSFKKKNRAFSDVNLFSSDCNCYNK